MRKTSEIGPNRPNAVDKHINKKIFEVDMSLLDRYLPSSQAMAGTGNLYRKVIYHTIKLSIKDFDVGT